MADEDGSTNMVVQKKEESFLSNEVELKKLLKSLSKVSQQAVDVLVALLKSDNEKTRFTAANRLLDLHVEVADKISLDQMNRLLAEFKVARTATPPPGGTLTLKQGEQPKENKPRPLVDFSTVREVG